MASPPASGPPRRCVVRKKLVEKRDVVEVTLSATRDWSELPLDALASIFGKLDAIEILMGAGLVCRSWLAAAKLPDLWRYVNMEDHKVVAEIEEFRSIRSPKPKINCDLLCAMARVAVDRSGGQMEAFEGNLFVTDELLKYIGDRSPALKALCLKSCSAVSNQGLTRQIAMCPMLEYLRLVNCHNVAGRDVYMAIGMACPRLEHFTLHRSLSWCVINSTCNPFDEALGVVAMRELRSLTLFNSYITYYHLELVLEGCPHLELLDLRCCFNIVDNNAVRAMCAGIKSLIFLPYKRIQEDEDGDQTFPFVNIDSDRDIDSDSDWDRVSDSDMNATVPWSLARLYALDIDFLSQSVDSCGHLSEFANLPV